MIRDTALEQALAEIDALAHAVLPLAAVDFDVATTIEDKAAAFRLRNLVAVQEGWIDADAFPDGLEYDAYDEDAVHIVGRAATPKRSGGAKRGIVATARLVFPAEGRLLPMEDVFDVRVEPIGRVVELGRQSIEPSFRRRNHATFFGLLAAAWLEIRRRGFDVLGGLASPQMLQRYDEMGFAMTVLAPAKWHWGEERHPIRFDVAANRTSLRDSLASLSDPSGATLP